ncbi:hypothetical protein ZOSMA_213G00080 [Zostera marina]|uniref:ABC transporter A family member n=1 Tax=Zostera marina TaxID=29655 RepID=A0A0K9PMK8_ZOSMR|nr:hypothetical protein ZOSMA_213G00080 [Zostera marina]
MEGSSFYTQSNALLRKNLAYQKRNIKTNICLISFPIIVCVLLVIFQGILDKEFNKQEKKCGCRCVDETDTDTKNCKKICGIQYSTSEQAFTCAIPNPPEWPPLLQVPRQEFRAVRTGKSSADLPKESCRKTKSCPATVLFTGQNQDFATSVSQNFFTNSSILNMFVPISSTNTSTADILNSLSQLSLGTDADTDLTRFLEPGFFSGRPIYTIHSTCNASNSKYQVNIPILQNSRVIKIGTIVQFPLINKTFLKLI